MNTDDLFQRAFMGDAYSGQEPAKPIGKGVAPETRDDYFQAAFGQTERKLPDTRYKTWRMTSKANKLSFSELMELQQHVDANTPYSQLPAWILEQGYVAPTHEEKKRQAEMERADSLTTAERSRVYSAFEAEIEVLKAFYDKETLRNNVFSGKQFEAAIDRFGVEEVMSALQESHPEAAMHYNAQLQVKAAEAKAAAVEAAQQADQERVRQEIAEAQNAIEMMRRDAVERGSEIDE